MTGDDQAALHALSAEPRSARAGETIRVLFRTRNVGTTPSPAGTVRFTLGHGLEALDPLDVTVDGVAPGEDVVAGVRARVAPPATERSEIVVRAALHVADAVLRTNACGIVVFGRPVFDGEASGTYVEALNADTVRVRAVVTNEGDGPASGVRIVVPVPLGCARDDGRAEENLEIPRLEVGEHAETAFAARIVAVVGEVRAEGGVVHFPGGRGVALPARGGVATEPRLAAPSVVVTPARRRADVTIGMRNDGWADARDVRVRVELPAGLRWIADGFALDGAIAGGRGAGAAALVRVERDGDARVLVVSAVPARRTVHVTFGATYGPACADGTISARLGEHVAEARFVPVHVRDVRVHLTDAVRAASPGELVTVTARVENAGDIAERLSFGISGLPFAEQSFSSRMVAAGCATEVHLGVAVPHDVPEGAPFTAVFVATADDGESARAEFVLHIRRRIPPELDERMSETAPQRVVPCVRAELQVPDAAIAGAPFGVRLVMDVNDAVDMLAVRAPAPEATAYVQGTATLDGRVLLDGTASGALSPFDGDGIVVRGVPECTRLVFAWSLRSDADEIAPRVVTVRVDADGETSVVTSPSIAIRARESFAARPADVPYHIETCATAPPCEAPWTTPAATPLSDLVGDEQGDAHHLTTDIADVPLTEPVAAAFEPFMRLGAERLADVSRLFVTARFEGLVQHLFVLRFFFPDAVEADGGSSAALEAVRDALRDVFDRLFVKLRIPAFDVSSDDLEDPQLRRATIALFQYPVFRAQNDGGCDDGVRAVLGDSGFGAPPVLRALVGLLPGRCDDDPAVGDALARYASALDLALSRYEGLPLELFDDALARRGDGALDAARAQLLGVLRPHLAPVALAC